MIINENSSIISIIKDDKIYIVKCCKCSSITEQRYDGIINDYEDGAIIRKLCPDCFHKDYLFCESCGDVISNSIEHDIYRHCDICYICNVLLNITDLFISYMD